VIDLSKIILYIAISTDGFIADKNGSVDWLPSADNNEDSDDNGTKLSIASLQTNNTITL
jgi:dihydrofolate reductase